MHMAKTFNSYNPVTNKVIGKYPIQLDKDVDRVVAQERIATSGWVKL